MTRLPATEPPRSHGQCSRRALAVAESARAADAEYVLMAVQRILAGSSRVARWPKREDTHDVLYSARRAAQCDDATCTRARGAGPGLLVSITQGTKSS